MAIGIDLRVLARGAFSGIEIYTRELTRALCIQFPEVAFRLFYNARTKAPFPRELQGFSHARVIERAIPNKLFEYAWRTPFPPAIDTILGGVDAMLAPHFLPVPTVRAPVITVVHDLSFVRHQEFFSLRKKYWHWLIDPKRQAKKAVHCIAVSESTKSDMCALWDIAPEKITVVYPGVDHEKFKPMPRIGEAMDAVRRKYQLPERFVLFVGMIEPRKNIIGLIRAFELLVAHYSLPITHFVIAGPQGWGDRPIFDVIQKSPVRDRIRYIGFVAEEDKAALYNLAELFVYPSFFEGFGFPPLEAMACGVPVITSNRSSLPEVVGDASILIDPSDIGQLAEVMQQILSDTNLQEYFQKKGIVRAEQFSWEDTARKTMAVLESVT